MTDTQDINHIALQIKSLEQRTTSVTLPRNASVLQLKQEIQIVFDVESNRQRLIFQGKVLKDDKNLDDYANLDNGKVIHLVIRPQDAPVNPNNDTPNPTRTTPTRFPMMEGYAFFSLDSSDMTDSNSLISSVLNGLATGYRPTERPVERPVERPAETPVEPTNNNLPTIPGSLRPPFAFSFGQRDTRPSLSSSSLGFPPNVEVRLARTLASMRNVRAMLREGNNEQRDSSSPLLSVNSTTEQLQEIRASLRTDGRTQLSQVSGALDQLADLTLETVPRLREIAESLRQPDDNTDLNRRVLSTSRVVQGMSLIHHFMGSVLSTMEIDSRRSRATHPPSRPSPRGETQAIRTPTAPPVTETNTASGSKRKNEEDQEDSVKKTKQEDGKGKKKTE
ncbi:hypothetical protein BY458DRAFT_527765 [Sporodiniella umbellata]|nr:hypothetical protein BY458DRAFT_527765 [Sporodiniella umbellata]